MAKHQKARPIPRERLRLLAFEAIDCSYLEPPYPFDEIRSVLEEVVAEFEKAAMETAADDDEEPR